MMMEPRIESNAWLDERDTWNTWIVGRLKPKVSPTQAEADLNAVAAEMARQFPDVNGDLHFKVRSEEHTSELQSRLHLVCRLLLEKKNTNPQCLSRTS